VNPEEGLARVGERLVVEQVLFNEVVVVADVVALLRFFVAVVRHPGQNEDQIKEDELDGKHGV
jgi:hypothetical protein